VIAERALGLKHSADEGLDLEDPRARPHDDRTVGDVFRGAFTASVEELLRLDAKLRSRDSADALHDARVAVRKLRSYLRSFLPILEKDWARDLRHELGWLNDCLSPARDLDVLIEALARRSAAISGIEFHRSRSLLARLRKERDESHASVLRALGDQRYFALFDDLANAARQPRMLRRAGEPAEKAGRAMLRRVWKKTRKSVRALGRFPSDLELHEVRITSKHVRYAAEALAPVIGKHVRRLARRAEDLQSALGEQRDAAVTMQHLHPFLNDPDVAIAAHGLARISRRAANSGRASWARAWRRMRKTYRRYQG
jgi:CHAD domain-containing protein